MADTSRPTASDSDSEQPCPEPLRLGLQQLWQQALQLAAEQQSKAAATPAENSEGEDDPHQLKKQLHGVEQQLKTHIATEQLLQKQLGKARIEIATLKSSQLNARLLEESASKEKAHVVQYQKQFEAAKAEIYQLNKALKEARLEHLAALEAQQLEHSLLSQQLADLTAKSGNSDSQQALLQQREAEIAQLTELLTNERQRSDELLQKSDTLQQQNDELLQQNSELQQQQELSSQPLELGEPSSAATTEQVETLEAELKTLHVELMDRDTIISDLTTALENAQQAIASLEQQLIEARSAAQAPQDEAKTAALEAHVKELNSHLRDYHAACNERTELQQGLSQLERKLVESHGQRESLSRRYDHLLTDLEVAVMKISDPALRAQLNQLIASHQNPPAASAQPPKPEAPKGQ